MAQRRDKDSPPPPFRKEVPEKKDGGDESSDAADFEKEGGKNMLSKVKMGTGQESPCDT